MAVNNAWWSIPGGQVLALLGKCRFEGELCVLLDECRFEGELCVFCLQLQFQCVLLFVSELVIIMSGDNRRPLIVAGALVAIKVHLRCTLGRRVSLHRQLQING